MSSDLDAFDQLELAAIKAMHREGFSQGRGWAEMGMAAYHQMHVFNQFTALNTDPETAKAENTAALAFQLAVLAAVAQSVNVSLRAAMVLAINNTPAIYDHLTAMPDGVAPVAKPKEPTP